MTMVERKLLLLTLEQERRWMVTLAAIMCLQGIVYETLFFTIW